MIVDSVRECTIWEALFVFIVQHEMKNTTIVQHSSDVFVYAGQIYKLIGCKDDDDSLPNVY